MPEPTKFAIPVPSEDPKKKKPEEKSEEDVKDGASKKKDEEKEGEDLVRDFRVVEVSRVSLDGHRSPKRIFS